MDKNNKPIAALSPFEKIRHTNVAGSEYWISREFGNLLGYANYRNFEPIIGSAKLACFNSGHRIEEHFVDITEMVQIGSSAQRGIQTTLLSRYACYLIIQNADPSKEIVAQGQTYFAIQTRRQELTDRSTEEERRIFLREEMKLHNVRLAGTAKTAGVVMPKDYAIFQDHGYRGLYGGLGARDIHSRKRLKKGQQILDHMGSTELAANLFRATQTEEKLRRENIIGKEQANSAHQEVGAKVRKTIHELGGTMPENLPTFSSIKEISNIKRKKMKVVKAQNIKK